ncbi:hypothetical protein EVAR_37071_1 [Eumeta japonica]|uniref:Uncharacterized protein n=1 Tax=Eumeta variegata TaxID=151549 RepID=A0A4C1WEY6_EUMVA|nr:hypothetical protein EVAR_37071_1 [Eumeta japonica]
MCVRPDRSTPQQAHSWGERARVSVSYRLFCGITPKTLQKENINRSRSQKVRLIFGITRMWGGTKSVKVTLGLGGGGRRAEGGRARALLTF